MLLVAVAAAACHAWQFRKIDFDKVRALQLKAFPQSNCHVCIKNHQHEKKNQFFYIFLS